MPFEAQFKEDEPDFDPHITEKLSNQTAIEYFIKVGITGLKRLLQNQKFTKSQRSKDAEDDYKLEIDSIKAYIVDNGKDALMVGTTTEAYLNYSTWCIQNGRKPLDNGQFGKVLKNEYHLESKQIGKGEFRTKRHYVEMPEM